MLQARLGGGAAIDQRRSGGALENCNCNCNCYTFCHTRVITLVAFDIRLVMTQLKHALDENLQCYFNDKRSI